jgi:5-methylcytosine-specific restriction protein A
MSTNTRIRGRALQAIRARHRSHNPLCAMCQAKGIVRAWTELDHVEPMEDGGADSDENRQGLCVECHRLKTAIQRGYTQQPRIGADGWPTAAPAVPTVVVPGRLRNPEHELRRLPRDLSPSRIPLTIVCGPPGGGKSTWVRNHVGPNDVVIDLDAILQRYSGRAEHDTVGTAWLGPALTERNRRLRALASDTTHERAWFIVSAPNPVERHHWAHMLGATVQLMAPPLEECIRRIRADPARRKHRDRMIAAARKWWQANATNERTTCAPPRGAMTMGGWA